ncbi:MAG: DeoR/GlpR transcriptional regulator [Clostridiaceae bacterium]|jgi:DeoR/GlpR family transcriptional regulator of sugar metabolism|nr:DeoR/GlpR transcriptional regulator [Clostridiaceae bacterium]
MFAIERIRIIKNYLQKESKVSVAKLSELLNVTEVTIRRDLEKLEAEGFLQRTHGGAVINNLVQDEPAEEQSDKYLIERQEIADTAFHLVSDNDMIMITEGLTNVQVARRLSRKNNLTVITNDVRIALEFKNSPSNNLILLGGDLNEYAVYGQLAINNMQYFSFNHLFVEVDAINKQTGMMASSISKASLIQKAMQSAESTTVVCLAKYFGEKSLYRIGSIETADRIITNSALDDSYKDYLFGLNIKIYTSVDIYEE